MENLQLKVFVNVVHFRNKKKRSKDFHFASIYTNQSRSLQATKAFFLSLLSFCFPFLFIFFLKKHIVFPFCMKLNQLLYSNQYLRSL